MLLQHAVWRHAPSGLTYLVEVDHRGRPVSASGPVDAALYREAVAFTDVTLIAGILDGDLPGFGTGAVPSGAVAMPQVDLQLLAGAVANALRQQAIESVRATDATEAANRDAEERRRRGLDVPTVGETNPARVFEPTSNEGAGAGVNPTPASTGDTINSSTPPPAVTQPPIPPPQPPIPSPASPGEPL